MAEHDCDYPLYHEDAEVVKTEILRVTGLVVPLIHVERSLGIAHELGLLGDP